ncbi:MAG: hypothetical protein WC323_01355 [Patescibacteria group bacterium]
MANSEIGVIYRCSNFGHEERVAAGEEEGVPLCQACLNAVKEFRRRKIRREEPSCRRNSNLVMLANSSGGRVPPRPMNGA